MSYLRLPEGCRLSGVVSKWSSRPVLECATLQRQGKRWWLFASDSYQLAKVPLEVVQDDCKRRLTAGRMSLEAVVAVEKAGAFRPEPDGIRPVRAKTGEPTAVRYDWQATECNQLPKIANDTLAKATKEDVGLVRFGVNPQFLASVAKALGSREQVEIVVRHPERAIEVRVSGQDGVAMVMPIRLTEPYRPIKEPRGA